MAVTKIAVTGGSGKAGRPVLRDLVERGHEVLNIDKVPSPESYAPDGPILCVRVADEGVKQALIADDPAVYFTIPHFDGYPAVLVLLDRIGVPELEEVITEAWLLRAQKRLAQAFLAER